MPKLFRPGRTALLGAVTLGALLMPAVGPAIAAPAPIVEWPMFHHDATHTGVSGESSISRSTVADLGLKWEANTGSSSFTSPAVVYSQQLARGLVIQGNQDGSLSAYDANSGDRIWVYKLPAHIQSSPAVANNVVYFGASDHYLHALNLATGTEICGFLADGVISSSPVVVNPDGAGMVVYFGDNGTTGSDDGGHEYAVNAVDPNAAVNCSLRWKFNGFGSPPGSQPDAGSWSPPAFGKDVNGRALLVFGSSSPDCAVYALDALTGQLAWRVQTTIYTQDNDVGAGPTVSPPGMNGFTDGVAYVAGKDRVLYAINLRTGAVIWQFNIHDDSTATEPVRSTAALLGRRLYVGYGRGLYALDAVTGVKVWRTEDVMAGVDEVVSSPAISGGLNDKVIFTGDMGGKVRAFNAITGAQMWSFATGGFIYGSPVVAAGHVYIASSDGFLYAFGLGGGVSAPPETVLDSPVADSTIPNPSGEVTITGTATDDASVARVFVAVKNRNSNKWWDPSSDMWTNVFTQYAAVLGSPGATSTGWQATFAAPSVGGEFFAQAEAIDSDSQHDPTVASAPFSVTSLGEPPDTTVDFPTFKQVFYFPGGVRQSFNITIRGTATDTSGAHQGVQKVFVQVKNREHGEYFCGAPGCAGGTQGEATAWGPTFVPVLATLDQPGATTTGWSLTIPTYDHPHSYFVAAWAVDNDGEVDQSRAMLARFCVRDPGNPFCA